MLKSNLENKLITDNFWNIVLILLCLAVLIFFQGCSLRTHVKGLESNARPLENKEYKVIDIAEGQSSSFHLLWNFPVTLPADYNKAIDEAIDEKGGDNLIDVRYWHERQYWIVGTIDILHVKGKVIRYEEE